MHIGDLIAEIDFPNTERSYRDSRMRALLLAAGIGKRLRPLTDTVPKCLVPICGRPLMDYWLDLLFEQGIDRVLINTHHLARQVNEFVSSSRWRDHIDLVYEAELLGTGGTIIANRAFFEGHPFLVAHADNLTDFDLRELVFAHAGRPSNCALTMMTFRTDDPQSCGIVELDPEGVVRQFHEKVESPPGNLANAATYVLEPEVVEYGLSLAKRAVDFQTEIIPAFLGRIFATEIARYHRDIGTPISLARSRQDYAKRYGMQGSNTLSNEQTAGSDVQ